MKKFAIRNKATGKFLGAKPSGGGPRQWGHVNDAQLWKTSGVISNVLPHIKEVQDYMAKTKRNYLYQSDRVNSRTNDMPVEIVEFDVILIDSTKGYIG